MTGLHNVHIGRFKRLHDSLGISLLGYCDIPNQTNYNLTNPLH